MSFYMLLVLRRGLEPLCLVTLTPQPEDKSVTGIAQFQIPDAYRFGCIPEYPLAQFRSETASKFLSI
jgi:hypothetical protein